jgi:hypothetical protein
MEQGQQQAVIAGSEATKIPCGEERTDCFASLAMTATYIRIPATHFARVVHE